MGLLVLRWDEVYFGHSVNGCKLFDVSAGGGLG